MIRKLRVITPTKLKTLCPVFGHMPQSFWTSDSRLIDWRRGQDSSVLHLISSNSQPLHQMDLQTFTRITCIKENGIPRFLRIVGHRV